MAANKRVVTDKDILDEADRNPDPITGAPGAHPVGVGVGAASAGAAGVAIGAAVGGPVGAPIGGAIGAVVGAVAGGYAGKAVAEAIDPTTEDTYWRENHASRPYASGTTYDEFQPAYRYGWESRGRYEDQAFEDVEPELERDWTGARGESRMDWDRAKLAARDAWERIKHPMSPQTDRDVGRIPR